MDVPPRQLILSLYGLYAREEGNWLSVASLIALMADLGTDSAAVPKPSRDSSDRSA